jgi:hypothetical protein
VALAPARKVAELERDVLELDATALAQQHADLRRAQVKLYRVPFVHIGSALWGEGQMHFICQVEPKLEGA